MDNQKLNEDLLFNHLWTVVLSILQGFSSNRMPFRDCDQQSKDNMDTARNKITDHYHLLFSLSSHSLFFVRQTILLLTLLLDKRRVSALLRKPNHVNMCVNNQRPNEDVFYTTHRFKPPYQAPLRYIF